MIIELTTFDIKENKNNFIFLNEFDLKKFFKDNLDIKKGVLKFLNKEEKDKKFENIKNILNPNFIFTNNIFETNEIHFKNRSYSTVCGILIEPRNHFALLFTIYNFFDTFPKNKLYLFCGNSVYNSNIKKDLEKIYPNLIIYNIGVDNLTYMEYNDFCKSMKLWDLIEEDFSIMVQTDGCFCKNSKYKINDFLKYDYIGGYSPFKWWWKETKGLHNYEDYQSFNGGFALKNNHATRECLNMFPPLNSNDFFEGQDFREFNEDLYFVVCMLKLNYNVGLDEFSTNYCTHTHYVKDTFCVHKLYFFLVKDKEDENYILKNEIIRFLDYCPEFINNIPDEYLNFWRVQKNINN